MDLFRAHSDRIDAIVLDMTMPKLSGEKALQAIRAIRPRIPAVLSSGFSEREITDRVADQAIGGFIQKPYTPPALVQKVPQALEESGTAPDDP